jgi:hypothetical protein
MEPRTWSIRRIHVLDDKQIDELAGVLPIVTGDCRTARALRLPAHSLCCEIRGDVRAGVGIGPMNDTFAQAIESIVA